MHDRENVIRLIEEEISVCESVNQCYRTIDLPALRDILALLKEQEAEIRQLRLALDIAKGTCKGIKSGGGQFADMPTMQSAT